MKQNPVTVVKTTIEDMRLPIDAESFERLAAIVGEKECNVSPLGRTILQFCRMYCEIGNFVIASIGGKFCAFTLEEWKAKENDR